MRAIAARPLDASFCGDVMRRNLADRHVWAVGLIWNMVGRKLRWIRTPSASSSPKRFLVADIEGRVSRGPGLFAAPTRLFE